MIRSMLQSIRSATFQGLTQATTALGAASVVQLAASIVRNKVLALTVGPQGVGLFAQLSSFLSITSLAGQAGLPTGAVRLVAEACSSGLGERLATIIKTAYGVTAVISMVVLLLIISLSGPIAASVLSNNQFANFIILIAFSGLFTSLSSIGEAVLRGFKAVAALSIARIVIAVIGILLLIPFVILYKVDGAVWSILLQAIIGAFFVNLIVALRIRKQKIALLKAGSYNITVQNDLLKMGFVVAITLVISTGTLFAIRAIIIQHLGLEQHGIFQAAWGLTQLYLQTVVGVLGSYTFPLVSQFQNGKDRIRVINESITFCLLIMAPVALIIMAFRNQLIQVFYSIAFLNATGLFPAKLAADAIYLMLWIIGTPLLPMNRSYAFILLHIVNSVLFSVGAVIFLPIWGLQGVIVANLMANTVSLIIYLIDARCAFGFVLSTLNSILLVGLLITIFFLNLLL